MRRAPALLVVAVSTSALLGAPAVASSKAASDAVIPAPAPQPVLQPASATGLEPTPRQLTRALAGPLADPALAGPVGVAVADARTGQVRHQQDGSTPLPPASTLKLLTAVAAIDALGSQQRLTTTVAMPRRGHLVLVGGGDATLTRATDRSLPPARRPASLDELAALVVGVLRHDQIRRVSLSYDDSRFTGPAVNPRWPAQYVTTGVIAPVVALMADEGRVAAGSDARVPDPALTAAQDFADQLRDRGLTVSDPVRKVSAADEGTLAQAPAVAHVDSPPLAVVVAAMLRDSDNQVAEALGRLTAAASGYPASFRGAVQALFADAAVRHLPVAQWRLFDASGLSRRDRATAEGLTALLSAVVPDPSLAPVVDGLPVAGFTGTLDDRYLHGAARAGAGFVRAKTGTLTGTSAEAGLVVTSGGRLLAFTLLAARVSATDAAAAHDALDRAATSLIGAGG